MKERKQDLGSEAWAPHLASLTTPVAHHPEQSNEESEMKDDYGTGWGGGQGAGLEG